MNTKQLLAALVIALSPSMAPALDLVETLELALESDPTLAESNSNRYAVNENRPQSIARLLPSLSVGWSTGRTRFFNQKATFQNSGVQYYWNHQATVSLNQPVFHWDYWVQLSQSDNQIAEAEAQYQAEVQNLIYRTTEAYFNVLLAQDSLTFATAEKESIARQLDQAKQRFEVGLIAITSVHEAQAAYDQARADEILAENEVDDAKESLREIIGENEINLVPLGSHMPLELPNPPDLLAWSDLAEKQNLNIIAAQNRAEVARKTIEIQQSGHLPTVDIVGDYLAQDNRATFGLRGDTATVGVEINLPLFEGGAVNSRTRQAHFEYNAAKDNLQAVTRTVKREVRNAYRGVVSSTSQVEALAATVLSSESALEATEAGFEVGTRTMVDVLTEQSDLYMAKRDHSQRRYDFILNSVKLKQSASNLEPDDLGKINSWLVGR